MAFPNPKISVIIPHYNMASFLPEAVESVANQNYKNIELVVVDDGSVECFSRDQLSANIEIKFLEIAHGGKPVAINCAFKESSGEYLVILDADDRLPETSLTKRVRALYENQADLSIGSFEVMYDGKIQHCREIINLKNKSKKALIQALLTSIISPFHQNAMMFSRDLLNRVGGMDPEMIRGQDKDFAVKLIQASKKLVFVDESVYFYNRYDRPFNTRIKNRWIGMKFKLMLIKKLTSGGKRIAYLGWVIFVETAKLIHDLFGIYKK